MQNLAEKSRPPKQALKRRTLRPILLFRIGEISPFCFYKMADRRAILSMYYAYILLNRTRTRTYTGVTDDVDNKMIRKEEFLWKDLSRKV